MLTEPSLFRVAAADALEQGPWQRARDGHEVGGWCTRATAACSTCPCAAPTGSMPPAALRSVGCTGDSYDKAAGESLIGLYNTELIRTRRASFEWPRPKPRPPCCAAGAPRPR